jgi:hypothetical protein
MVPRWRLGADDEAPAHQAMSMLQWTAVVAAVAAILLLGTLAFAVRSAAGESQPLALSVSVHTGASPCVELSLKLQSGHRRVVVHTFAVDRGAVEVLGLSPPPEFAERAYVAADRRSFEADLEELADRTPAPTPEQIASEEARQYAEYREALERLNRDNVLYTGRLVLTKSGERTLRFPIAHLRPATGHISVSFRSRVGPWSQSSGQSVEFSTAVR